MAGGDTLYVKNGTYNEAFTISGPAGAPGATTKILAYPGHAPILRGAGISGGRMKIAGTSYIDFEGLTLTNYNQGLYVDNDSGTKSPANNINVRNVIVHDVGQECIAARGNVSFILFESVTVFNCGLLGGQNGEGIYVGGASSTDNSHHVTIRNSIVHDTKDEGIELKHDTHDCVVEGNEIYRALNPGSSFSNTGGAIEINEPQGSFTGNPNHIIRNNVIHDILFTSGITKRGIRCGTGCTVYNNVLYNIASPYEAILSNSASPGNFPRLIYHNTIDVPSSRAVVNSGGTDLVSRNNIGPTGTNNLATNAAYFVNQAGANYHLVAGSAPINAGADLTSVVATDIEGTSRLTSPPTDIGAYEYLVSESRPSSPTSLMLQ